MKIKVVYHKDGEKMHIVEYFDVVMVENSDICGIRCFKSVNDIGTYNYTFIYRDDVFTAEVVDRIKN